MEYRDISLEELLEAREKRVARQRDLLAKFDGTLISCTMNIPGPRKCGPLIIRGFQLGRKLLLAQLGGEGIPLLHQEEYIAPTGCEGYFVVKEEPKRVKKLAVQIEDAYPWTRLLDVDIISAAGRKLSREELGLPSRRCLLCGKPAMVCARSRAHGLTALTECTHQLLSQAVWEADSRLCGELAAKALLYEVCAAPKPGLVDRLGRGSHEDMDIFTFLSSTAALQPYFAQCARVGMETAELAPGETFSRLRLVGKEAEAAMLRATEGVNTHKGAIFTLGLLCGALGRLPRQQWGDWKTVLALCAAMTQGITAKELGSSTATRNPTAGQRAFQEVGSPGARGQAEQGFPAVAGTGIPALQEGLARGMSPEEAGCCALLHLMVVCGDTNLFARGGAGGQQEAVKLVKDLLKKEPFPCRQTLLELDRVFREKKLSPGGSADLLAASWLLLFASQGENG